jgi:hypothetical protein
MPEEKKRFPWWLVAASLLLAICGLLFGLIETFGRQGTLIGRSESINRGMPSGEVIRILGWPDDGGDRLRRHFVGFRHGVPGASVRTYRNWGELRDDLIFAQGTALLRWDEGPAHVWVEFDQGNWTVQDHWERRAFRTASEVDGRRSTLWQLRRWAEKAYTAIHGPRR